MNMTAVAIVAIICWGIVSLTKPSATKKKHKADLQKLEDEQAQMKHDLDEMSKRLAVLEKIVTDEKYELNKAFDDLK